MKWRLLLLPTFKIRGGNKGGTLKSSNIVCSLFTYMVGSGNEFELVGSSEYSVSDLSKYTQLAQRLGYPF